jgi:hypothetical protein
MKHESYHSYLLRFWQEDCGGEPDKIWRGEVESIQTGQKWQFNSLDDLFRFLRRKMARMTTHDTDQEDKSTSSS